MAVKKATTTDDIKQAPEPVEQATEPVEQVDGSVEEGYTRLVSPDGKETTVPNSIVESLTDSGYERK